MGHQETIGTALKSANLSFVTNKKGATTGAGGFGMFKSRLLDCAKLAEEHLGEGR